MFVGHATLAFALAAGAAHARGRSRRSALAVGVAAALFATVPDVDMAYAPVGLLGADGDPLALASGFWGASTVVHRSVTHSVVTALPAAAAFACWTVDRRVAAAALVGLVGLAAAVSGALAGVVMALFALAGVGVATLATRLDDDVGPRTVLAAAALGLVSHPFGDLFTGEPPRILYPLDVVVFEARLAPFADPTLNLLGAFAVELLAIWTGVLALAWLSRRRVRDHVSPTATLGVVYGVAAFFLPPPTMETSYPFVLSVLSVGVVGVARPRRRVRAVAPSNPLTAVATGLAAVTLAVLAYAVVYAVA